jgi:hypothetical protein
MSSEQERSAPTMAGSAGDRRRGPRGTAAVLRNVLGIAEVDGAGYWCYFRDPEGNVFELSQRLAPNPPRNR